MNFNRTRTWFTIVEALIAMMIMVIFFLWSLKFFSVQNKNIETLRNYWWSQDLINEVESYFLSYDYNDLVPWVYWLYYVPYSTTDINSISKYYVWLVTENINSNEKGKYIYPDWKLVDINSFNWQWNMLNVYKRIIKIEEPYYPYNHQNIKKITVKLWDPECDFEQDACMVRTFMKSSYNDKWWKKTWINAVSFDLWTQINANLYQDYFTNEIAVTWMDPWAEIRAFADIWTIYKNGFAVWNNTNVNYWDKIKVKVRSWWLWEVVIVKLQIWSQVWTYSLASIPKDTIPDLTILDARSLQLSTFKQTQQYTITSINTWALVTIQSWSGFISINSWAWISSWIVNLNDKISFKWLSSWMYYQNSTTVFNIWWWSFPLNVYTTYPVTCYQLFLDWQTISGDYLLDPDWPWTSISPSNFYCDMTTDWWWWTRITSLIWWNTSYCDTNNFWKDALNFSNAIWAWWKLLSKYYSVSWVAPWNSPSSVVKFDMPYWYMQTAFLFSNNTNIWNINATTWLNLQVISWPAYWNNIWWDYWTYPNYEANFCIWNPPAHQACIHMWTAHWVCWSIYHDWAWSSASRAHELYFKETSFFWDNTFYAPLKSCLEHKNAWRNESWWYKIDPDWGWSLPSTTVMCDMINNWWWWTLFARSTWTTDVYWISDLWVPNDFQSYSYNCTNWQSTASETRLIMGSIVDYFKPTAWNDFCWMLNSYSKHQWKWWPANYATWITPPFYNNHKWWSAVYWPKNNIAWDARNYLSFWSQQPSWSNQWWCCSAINSVSADAWLKPFTFWYR